MKKVDLMFKTEFAELIKEKMSASANPDHIGGTWHGRPYPHICKELKYNFIDGDVPVYCCLKQLRGSKIHYHQGASHLNSSQVMCISFFKKFFESPEYEILLLKILNELTIINPKNNIIPTGATIKAAYFEYEPNPLERTNFDFYLELSSGAHISIEVKFTESTFGKISPNKNDPQKYARKWTNTYIPLLKKCVYSKDKLLTCSNSSQAIICTKDCALNKNCAHNEGCFIHEFFDHYQIWRNISYATSQTDIVLFLTPRANETLKIERDYIDKLGKQFNGPIIQNMYWEDLVSKTLEYCAEDQKLLAYFKLFTEKYLLI